MADPSSTDMSQLFLAAGAVIGLPNDQMAISALVSTLLHLDGIKAVTAKMDGQPPKHFPSGENVADTWACGSFPFFTAPGHGGLFEVYFADAEALEKWRPYLSNFASIFACAQQLREARAALEDNNRSLESKVEERSAALKDALQRVEARNADLRALSVELSAATRAKSNLLACASHELRTPLNAIQGFAECMQMQIYGPLPDGYTEPITNILVSSDRMLGQVETLLTAVGQGDGSKTHQSATRLEPLGDVLHQLAARHKRLLDFSDIRLHLKLTCRDHSVPCPDVETILRQLLDNAIKFSKAGDEITIACDCDSEHATIVSVKDHGCGMTPEKTALLAQEKSLGGQYQTPDGAGLGLGLPLAFTLADAIGGELLLESTPDVGTTASIIIPKHQTDVRQPTELKR